MRLVLHPKVYSDIEEIMGYYERVATRELADEFYSEFRYYVQQAPDDGFNDGKSNRFSRTA
jgi:hypothetical protein